MKWPRRLLSALAAALVAACANPARVRAEPVQAFKDVTVIRAYGRPYLQHQTVVVQGRRIVAVGPANRIKLPPIALVLGRPGQIVAPGLADMHAHIFEPGDGVLFLANGVTTVRNMHGRPDTDALAARIEAGTEPGPHIYSSGPLIDQPPGGRGEYTPGDMRRLAAEQAKAGYIALKLYDDLTPAAFAAGVEAARAHGLQVYAHVPAAMTVDQVIALRIDSMEHLFGFDRALAPSSASDWDEERWAAADPRLMRPLAIRVAKSGVWDTATLILMETPHAFADIQAAEASPLYRYATPRERALWRRLYDSARAERDPASSWVMTQRAHQARLAMLRTLHEAHASLLIGTDAPQPFNYPGFSLHEEFALHRDAGFSRAEILRIATAEAARFLRRAGEFGVIAPGARADILLLDADPEADLSVLKKPAGVMAAGRWYDAAALQQMLDRLAEARATPSPQPARP